MIREQQLICFYSLLSKEIIRFMRIWIQTLVPPAITMTLYFVIFGELVGSRVGMMGNYPYVQFIAPGLIMMSVITSAYANVASSFFSAKFQRSVEELLVAPVPIPIMIFGYVMGGVTRGILVGVIVTLVAAFFVPLEFHHVGYVLITLVMTAMLFALAGLVNAVFAKTFDDINLIPTFVLTPLTYLGGVFYSLSLLPEFWQYVSRLNPIVYIVNGFRYGFLGVSDVPINIAFSLLALFIIALYGICHLLIKRGIGLRS